MKQSSFSSLQNLFFKHMLDLREKVIIMNSRLKKTIFNIFLIVSFLMSSCDINDFSNTSRSYLKIHT